MHKYRYGTSVVNIVFLFSFSPPLSCFDQIDLNMNVGAFSNNGVHERIIYKIMRFHVNTNEGIWSMIYVKETNLWTIN